LTKYDYIIIGAGCAGLSLLMRMMRSGALNNRKPAAGGQIAQAVK
jgi:pyruvate/2-oxoglutarate dehydrogenase complex dihydrolipoamide dehydrogenase (E3) component